MEKFENLDEFIEVDDNEIFQGDQHLKIEVTPPVINKKEDEKVIKPTQKIEENEEDLIEIDDNSNPDNNEEEEELEELEDDSPKKGTKPVAKKTGDSNESITTPDNEFSAFATSLNEQGFFPDIEDEELLEIRNEEDLQEKLNKQLVTTFNKWQDTYKQNLINNLIEEGIINKNDVKADLVSFYTKEDIKGNLELAKQVHQEFYQRKGLPDKQIQRIISGVEDLEESALELYDENVKEKAKEQTLIAAKLKEKEELANKQRLEFTETLKQNTFNYEEIIPNKKLRKQDKEEIFANIEVVSKKINGDLAKYLPILSALDRYGLLDLKFDKILKEGKTQSVSQLEQILKDKKRNTGGSTRSTPSNSNIKIDDSDIRQIYK